MIYADYNGSAPMLLSVRQHLKRRLDSELFANPNAIHSMGQKLMAGIEKCRGIVAGVVGSYPDQIVFNSGASEGISTIIHSVLAQTDKKIVITSPIEHAAVVESLQASGRELKFVQVSTDGLISFESFRLLLEKHKHELALVAIMAVNNETGVIQPYQDIARECQKFGVEFFSDTTQIIGKGEFNFRDSGIDYAVCSGHKIGALTGTGFVMVKDSTKLLPLIYGKNQEKGLRGGTQHYLGIETLAVALSDFAENKKNLKGLSEARLNFEKEIKAAFPQVIIVGDTAPRLPGTTLLGYPGVHGQAVQIELESHDIFVTTSAACSDNQPETSEVLRSMGIDDQLGRGVVRISLSYSHGSREYSALALALKQAYNKLTKIQSY